jgi:hypothetical protein
VLFEEPDLAHMRRAHMMGLSITGYYFRAGWREFVYRDNDGYWIQILHPSGQAIKKLRCLLAPRGVRVRGPDRC